MALITAAHLSHREAAKRRNGDKFNYCATIFPRSTRWTSPSSERGFKGYVHVLFSDNKVGETPTEFFEKWGRHFQSKVQAETLFMASNHGEATSLQEIKCSHTSMPHVHIMYYHYRDCPLTKFIWGFLKPKFKGSIGWRKVSCTGCGYVYLGTGRGDKRILDQYGHSISVMSQLYQSCPLHGGVPSGAKRGIQQASLSLRSTPDSEEDERSSDDGGQRKRVRHGSSSVAYTRGMQNHANKMRWARDFINKYKTDDYNKFNFLIATSGDDDLIDLHTGYQNVNNYVQ